MDQLTEFDRPLMGVVVKELVEVNPSVKGAAVLAVTEVVEHSLRKCEDITIVFASGITDTNTKIVMPHASETFPDGKTIVFAMDSELLKTYVEQFGPIGSMLIMAAHEAKHVVQIRSGNPPPQLG